MLHRISRGIAGTLAALLATGVLLQPVVARADDGGTPSPVETAAVTPQALPTTSETPTPSATPSDSPTPETPTAEPEVKSNGASVTPLVTDDSNGVVKVKVTQAGADSTGTRTAATGTKFDYKLNISCSSVDGPCLTDGKVTLDLSAWKGYDFSFQADGAQVTGHNWNTTTGILTLDLADIGQTVTSFTWSFSIKTPDTVTSTLNADHAAELTFDATVSGKDFESVTSKSVTSYTTAALPTNTLEKKAAGDQFIGSVGNTTWNIFDTAGPKTGIVVPSDLRVITDVLPAGLDFVSCDTDATWTWEPCVYDDATRTVSFTSKSTLPSGDREQVGHIVTTTPDSATAASFTNTAAVDMGAEHKTATGTVNVKAVPVPPSGPRTSGYSAQKFSLSPIVLANHNRFPYKPVSVASFTGNWKDDGSGVNTEASYSIGWADGGEGDTKSVGILDDIPCLTNKSGTSGSAIYSSQKTGLCTDPAFYLTHVATDGNYYNDGNKQSPDVPVFITLTDGSVIEVPWTQRSVGNYTRWDIPQQYWGRVARVEIKPTWTSGDPKPSKNGNPKGLYVANNNGAQLRFSGYYPSDKGLQDGDIVRNEKADVTWAQSPKGQYKSFPDYTEQTAIDYATSASPRVEADVKIIDAIEGASKSIASQTSSVDDTVAPTYDWSLKVYSQTGLRDLQGPFVTITDLWPKTVAIPDELLTQPTKWYGMDDNGTTPVASAIPSVKLDYTATQHLLQWKIPVSVFNDLQHANKGSKVFIGTRLPTVTKASYGTSTNELEVQMAAGDNPKANISDGSSQADSATNGGWDGDAATTKSAKSTSNATRTATGGAAAFDLAKSVKGDLNTGFMFNPARGSTTPGTGGAEFNLDFKNTGTAALTDSVIYDILPYAGDKGTLLVDQGRGSTVDTLLTAVTAPATGITVHYSQSTNPCRPELIDNADNDTCVDDWTTTAPALSTVKALKWVNSNSVAAGQAWSAKFTLQAPADMTDPDVAWNDVAGAAKEAGQADFLLPVSAPKVGIHNSQVGDPVWQKLNTVGNKIGGSEWELQEVDGSDNPVGSAIVVKDNVGAGGYVGEDIDSKPGILRINGFAHGLVAGTKYRLIETKAPTGYEVDSTPHYVTAVMNADWSFGDLVNYVYTAPGASGSTTARYDVDYDWSISKAVETAKKWVDPNTDADFDYTITVGATQGAPSNLTVSGTAIFTNPSGPGLTGTASITTDSGATCTLTDPAAASIAHGEQLSVPFTCDYPTTDDDTVHVTFTDGKGAATADIPVRFKIAGESDKTVQLTDTFAELNGPRTLNASDIVKDGGSATYSYTAARTAGGYGQCLPYSNTATLAATSDQAELSATADAEACGRYVEPTTDTAGGQGYYNTDYDWALGKTVDQNVVEVPAGATQPFGYRVTVTPTKSTNTVTSTGWVEFVNPNDVELTGSLTLSALTGTCTLFAGDTLTIAAGSSQYVYFDCSYPDVQPSAADKVTVTFTSDPTPSGVLVATKVVTLAFGQFEVTDQTTTVSDTFLEFGGDKVLDAEQLLATPALGVFNYPANQTASLTPGQCDTYDNTASLPASSDQGDLSETVTVGLCTQANPGIKLTKTADKATYVAGDQLTYTLVAQNTGDSTLSDVVITEPAGGFNGSDAISAIGDCKVGSSAATMPVTLAPGEKLTCTATYVASQADLDQGQLVNSAHVDGAPAYGPHLTDDDSVTVVGDQHSAIDLTKTADKVALKVGDQVTYTFTTKNTGNTTLSDITVSEKDFNGAGQLGPIGGCQVDGVAAAMPGTLAPGKVMVCTAAYTVTQADVDRGVLTNNAHVEGTPPSTDPSDPDSKKPMDDDKVEITGSATPGIELVKTANRTKFGFGDVITYTLTATNTGVVTLSGVKIAETDFNGGKLPAVSGCEVAGAPVTMPATLAPGQVLTCTAKYVATRTDVMRGDLANVARVVGTPPSGPELTDASEVDLSAAKPAAKLALVKKVARIVDANGDSVVNAGDKIQWTFKVTNKSKVTLKKLAITDKLLAEAGVPITCSTKPLAAGASTLCVSTKWYVVTEQDVALGRVFNTATASAEGSKQGLYVSNPDSTITATNMTAVLGAEDTDPNGASDGGSNKNSNSGDGKDLAFTGFAGGSIAIAGGLFAALGVLVLIVVRRRRAGQEG